MRDVDSASITDAVLRTFASARAPRSKAVIEPLVRHLHAFAREAKPTHAEWLGALDFLAACGRMTTAERHELVLLSDVLGLSALVDMLNQAPGATAGSNLGPFYAADSPRVPAGADLRRGQPGETVVLRGYVRDTRGRPVAGAEIDLWSNADNALYPAQDPAQPPDNLRCRMSVGADGAYSVVTIRPRPYTVPYDGPVGELLRAGGRHAWRPAHFHFRVAAPGHVPITTEVFLAGDEYIDEDAVFGVRASLVKALERCADAARVAPLAVAPPFWLLENDFALAAT